MKEIYGMAEKNLKKIWAKIKRNLNFTEGKFEGTAKEIRKNFEVL